MSKLTVRADNMFVERDGSGRHVAALKQSYDGGWSVFSDPEPLGAEFPSGTFHLREELIAALTEAGHDVAVEPASREGAGHCINGGRFATRRCHARA